ncbi:MAG: hypothetical protein PHS80_02930 [Methanothrix sp.]|nr:hypothetical protein [Methanothrix sp.]MDD4447019.1 hypothetical protein [Methanothrix sp.]
MLKRLIKVPAKVVIDTGPLLLFLIGNYDPEYIPKMKRIKYGGMPCNKIHYDILKQYLNCTAERLITPGILSEAWNLIDNDISNKKDKKEIFDVNNKYFKLINEVYVSKNEILFDKYLSSNAWKFGFTDSSLILCAKNNCACVLTQDFPLFNICKNLRIDSNHLSSILSLADL